MTIQEGFHRPQPRSRSAVESHERQHRYRAQVSAKRGPNCLARACKVLLKPGLIRDACAVAIRGDAKAALDGFKAGLELVDDDPLGVAGLAYAVYVGAGPRRLEDRGF